MDLRADLRPDSSVRGTARDRWTSSTPRSQRRLGEYSNAVLAALSTEAMDLLSAQLSRASLLAGETLLSAGEFVDEVIFLETGLAKIFTPLDSGDTAPATLVGREGVIGLGPAICGRPGQTTASVVVSGCGWRLSATALGRQLSTRPELFQPLINCLALQVSELQAEAACNAQHTTEQRLAKLLLAARTRLDTDRLPLTQEDLAMILGVRRPTVSTIARRLKTRGALTYLRGMIRIADLDRLKAVACCCSVDTDEDTQSLPAAAGARG